MDGTTETLDHCAAVAAASLRPAHSGDGTPTDTQTLSRQGFRWHVLHTRSRQEKVVAEVVEAAGAKVFLPLRRQVRFYGHRKRAVELPLFSCYLFVWGRPDHAYHATSLKRAARVIPVDDQARLESEITQIREAMERGADLGEHRFLARGMRVRVSRGPFQGLEGVIDSGIRGDRLVLGVHAIGQALSLEIDVSLVEPAA